MKSISEIDKNFSESKYFGREDIEFFKYDEKPFKLYGVYYEDGKFRRMPEDIAEKTNEGVLSLHACTAGGRLRFKTDSMYVAISAKMGGVGEMRHFAPSGSAGFDMYVTNRGKEEYYRSYIPFFNDNKELHSIITFETKKMREITINFPLYSEVCSLFIGVQEKSKLMGADEYKITTPFVYYGSSITQGGCASRPGSSYQARISREFSCDYLNFGFSGNAKGEDIIMDYIASLDMSMFVYDYDHNAPTVEHLRDTHERGFKKVREKHPDIPIILMSRPKYYLNAEEKERLEVIKATYNNAIVAGDKNVYLITGRELMRYAKNEGTVDNCHPTDLGFFSMSKTMCKEIHKILNK